MKKFLPIIIVLPLLISACSNQEETEYNETQEGHTIELNYDEFSLELEQLEADILSSEIPNQELLKEAVIKFQDFAGAFPEDPKSPDYLLKASDFSMALNEAEKSVKILDIIIKKYPNYNRMEDVMYVKASHIDFNLRDTTRAKKAYSDFIEAYPDSELIDDCKIRIKFISYSLEEYADKLIKDLEDQQN